MGCGAIGKPRSELTGEEKSLLLEAEDLRQQIIKEVCSVREATKAKQEQNRCSGIRTSQASEGLLKRESAISRKSLGVSSSCGSVKDRRSVGSSSSSCELSGSSSKSSYEEQHSGRNTLGNGLRGSSHLAAPPNRFSTGSSRSTTSNGAPRPLKRSCHKSRNSITESELVGVGSLTLSVPGKVGAQDESVAVDGSHMIMKTRKVHKHKDYAKKVYARRRLGSIEINEGVPFQSEGGEDNNKLREEDKKKLMKSVQRHFLFSALFKAEQQMLLDQMVYQENQEGEIVCKMGEKGDACYMLISGICVAEREGIGQVAQFSAGDLFGELAMLYDVPRTANVICVSPRVALGVIRGHTFRKSLAIARERRISSTLEFLNTHKIFSKLTLDEKRMLGNALNFETFEPGALLLDDNISHTCEWMFLVQEGSVEVHDGYRNHKVLGAGATISGRNMPYGNHAVLAKALSHVRCLSIGYSVMNRLFGNISEVLRISTIRSFLEPLSFFGQLTDKQQGLLAACFQEQKVNNGDIVVSALADPQLVLVMEGEVSVLDLSESACVHSPSGRIESLKLDKKMAEEVISRRSSRASEEPSGESGTFSSVVPANPAGALLESCAEPEMEVPPMESPRDRDRKISGLGPMPDTIKAIPERVKGEIRRLYRGDLFGDDTFREDKRMQYSLVASTDGIVCRAGHDDVCRALRGCCEQTPPLSWILLRNQVKKLLQKEFPFSALYDEMLDMIVEAFERIEYPSSAQIVKTNEETFSFFMIVEGEAVISRDVNSDGMLLQPMERWAVYGKAQLLLGAPCDADISAAASGCSILSIGHQAFLDATGVLCNELQIKMLNQNLSISMNDCQTESILGKGQFGTVRRVQINDYFELVPEGFALKSMSKKRVLELEQASACKLEREILQECCHPLIVRLITTFQDESNVHLVMETLSGGDLFTAIRDIGTLNEDHILFYSASIILGIEYIHSRGIVYRDLKPENIMLTGDGFVKIVDFGCCTRKNRSYTFTGTPEYLAPEVILGKGYDKAVDWWGLGVIMYEMICGPLPFGESCADPLAVMREVLEKELVFPVQVRGDPSEDLLKCLLERMPEQRLGGSTSSWQSEVRQHAFFEDLQWDAILEQTTQPPHAPPVTLEDPSIMVGRMTSDGSSASAFSKRSSLALEQDTEPPDADADLSCFEGF